MPADRPDRRTVLCGAAAVGALAASTGLLAACGGEDSAPTGTATSPGTGTPTTSGSAARPGGPALARTSDVPVGGGTVLKEAKVVLTQPEAGTVKAFSAICTHMGCIVAEVRDSTINCRCHGSKFAITDGSVRSGPAAQPLPPVAISVQGDQIVPA